MKLVSVEIRNFRQFYGTQRVEFSQSLDKNITLIHAENGVGKTAFLNAILWCLFEQTTDNFEHPNILLNNQSKAEGQYGYYVFVGFENEGKEYIAQRQYTKASGLVFAAFEILPNGNHSPIDNPNYFINSIIPKEMARYFFFQGEGVGSFASNNRNGVGEAIRTILGFTVAEQAQNDIEKIKSEYRRELARVDKTSELGDLQIKIASAEENISNYEKRIEELDKEVRYLGNELERANQEYRESNIEVLRAKQSERDSKEKELGRLKEQQKSAYFRKADLITIFSTSVFAKKIADEGIDFIDEKELKGTIPAPYNEQLVLDILASSKCICGATIKEGSEAYANIHKLIETAADPVLINRVRRARGQLTGIRKDLRIVERQFYGVQKDLTSATTNIEKITRELSDISVAIKGINVEKIAEKEQRREALGHQLSQANRSLGSNKNNLDRESSLLQSLKGEERRLGARTPEISKIKNTILFVEELEKKLREKLKSAESGSKLLLMEKINHFLELYVRQDFKAKMTEDYEIILFDRGGNKVPKSDGQSLLLSLTFISSLIYIAKERVNASGEILQPGAIAPFVIDAPFGVLDNEYKANVAREIPKAVNQVVLLLSTSHWEGTVEEVIRDRIGAEYNMQLNVASDVKKDVVSNIKILGKKYKSVVYNSERDMTIMEEIGRYE